MANFEIPCPHCTGPEAAAARQAARDAYGAWSNEENDAYIAYANGPDAPQWDAHKAWKHTEAYRELKAREPEPPADHGCPECNFTGTVLTDLGAEALEFARRRR